MLKLMLINKSETCKINFSGYKANIMDISGVTDRRTHFTTWKSIKFVQLVQNAEINAYEIIFIWKKKYC